MTVTVYASGTQSATTGTDHTLSAPTAAGVYQLLTDCFEMIDGDILELRVEAKVLTGGTKRILFAATYAGPQEEPIKISPPVTLPFGGDFILNLMQAAGSPATRSFDWSLMTV